MIPPSRHILPAAKRTSGTIAILMAVAAVAGSNPCSPVTVGVDTSHGNHYYAVYDCSAYGQVFQAQDTVIQAITVWRDPTMNNTPLRLFVMQLDSTGTPDVSHILLVGPTLQIEYGDGVHPVEFRFVLDPPLALPGPGSYELAAQVAPPGPDGATSLLGDTLNPYPGGEAWRHPRSDPFFDCQLRSPRPTPAGLDLVFQVEFCAKTPTPVRRPTWGRLKLRYR